MNVRLDGPGTTDGSGRFVCGGSVPLRGEKRVKGCMARVFDKPARAMRHVTKVQRLRDEYIAGQSFAQRIGSGSTPGASKHLAISSIPLPSLRLPNA
jgi:hypothetical protein